MVDFGIGMGANGQIQPMMILTSSGNQQPTEYASYFETPEGVRITLTVHSDNKTLADTVEQDIAKAMNWKIHEAAPEKPMSLGGELAMGWAVSAIIIFVLGFIGFIGVAVAQMAGYVGFNDVDSFIGHSARYALWAFPVFALVINAGSLLNALSDKRE